MDILQDLFTMPQETISGSLLPAGINLESLDPDEDMDSSTVMDHDNSHLTLFGIDKQMVDHNMNDSPHKVALGTGAKNLMVRLGSQGSVLDSDTDLEGSQSEFESVNSSKCMPETSKEDSNVTNSSLVFTSADMLEPRCTTPDDSLPGAQLLPNTVQDLDQKLNPVTPTKPEDSDNPDPWTPTANLKVLMNAASPEIRNRDRQKEINKSIKNITHDPFDNDDEVSHAEQGSAILKQTKSKGKKSRGKSSKNCEVSVPDDQVVVDEECDLDLEIDSSQIQGPSRKDKSLGLLCQRFLSMFPKYPGPFENIAICLDEVAKDLLVERRRIYDIVNVLESVEIVSRQAKNKYIWHGKTNLKHTLAKLQTLAKMEGFVEQVEKIKDFEVSRELESENSNQNVKGKLSQSSLEDSTDKEAKAEACKAGCTNFLRDNLKKDKSLGIMSQRFIMLFLISKPKTVNLDLSAKILVGDPNIDRTENAKFKTKIRRLYDIANILTSLELIKKVHVTEVRGRKPAFKYIGPDIDHVDQIASCSHDGAHRPSSKHSLLDCIQNPQVCTMLNAHKSFKPTGSKNSLLDASSSHSEGSFPPPLAKKSFSRHSSFNQICEVAELERTRLYFESSRSQPSSPNKFLSTPDDQRVVKQPSIVKPSSSHTSHRLIVLKDNKDSKPANLAPVTVPAPAQGDGSAAGSFVIKEEDGVILPDLGKTVILKAVGTESGVLSLTEKQLREIIKSLGTKVVNISSGASANSENASKLVDAATQSSPHPSAGLLSKVKEDSKLPNSSQLPPKLKIIRVSRPGCNSVSEGVQTVPQHKPAVPQAVRVKRSLEEGFRQAQELEPCTKKVKRDADDEMSVDQYSLTENGRNSEQQGTVSTEQDLTDNLEAKPIVAITHQVSLPETTPVLEKDIPHEKVLLENSEVEITPTAFPVTFATPILPAPHKISSMFLPTKPAPHQFHANSLVQPQSTSQPNTPSFCLHPGGSPVMIIPARPASLEGLPQMIETPPSISKDPNLVIPQPKLLLPSVQPTDYSTLVSPVPAGIGHIPGTMVFGSTTMSPLQQLQEPLITPTSHNAMVNAAAASPLFDNFPMASTPSSIHSQVMRPLGGYRPSPSNIINLAPFFNSPTGKEQEATRAVISDPTKHIGRIISAAPHAVSQSQQFIRMVSAVQPASQSSSNSMLSPVNTLLTPKTIINPITINGKPVSTPGCFFRSTPGGLQQVGFQGQNSAFQVVNRLTIQNGEGPISTARRLQLTGEGTKPTLF